MKRNYQYLILLIIFITMGIHTFAQGDIDMKIKTVVIDPGHGGKDPGTVSRNGKVYEKNIVLAVALELGKQIKNNYPNVKVIYTRSNDKFVPLHERANIANRNKADLFISIHVNAAEATSARGSETLVMGMDKTNSNLEVCLKENSVVSLEEDYDSKYSGYDPNNPESFIIFSLLQNSHLEQSLIFAAKVQENLKKGPISASRGIKQGPILVLWKCTMPSTLIELGFLSNSTDYKYLTNKTYQQNMARAIFNAFSSYKKEYEKKNTNHIEVSEIANLTQYFTDRKSVV